MTATKTKLSEEQDRKAANRFRSKNHLRKLIPDDTMCP